MNASPIVHPLCAIGNAARHRRHEIHPSRIRRKV
jgi:hypothetical protein